MLSEQQKQALQRIEAWRGTASPVFYLAGYAGTGKTTIAKEVKGAVLFAAPTAKAALVLDDKGCVPVSTIHKLIYLPKEKSRQELRRLEALLPTLAPSEIQYLETERLIAVEKERLKSVNFTLNPESQLRGADLLVVDEASMVDGIVGKDLESFGVKILALGDPAQLPPVRGAGHFCKRKPDFTLTEIHRQAQGSPVLQLATQIRQGKSVDYCDMGGGTGVVPRGRYSIQEVVDEFDQVIVGRNATRRAANQQIRKAKGFKGEFPEPGERLICLRNNYDSGLLNGSQWDVVSCHTDGNFLGLTVEDPNTGVMVSTSAHPEPFLNQEVPFWGKTDADEFDFGYAVTCHKAQGSQWDSVLVRDESGCFSPNASRWLYTAVTRAANRVVVVR